MWNLVKEAANITKCNKIIIHNLEDKNGTKLTEKKDIVREFNTFFSNVGAEISKKIKNSNFKKVSFTDLNKNCHITSSIFLRPIEPSEIVNLINKCKQNNSFCNNYLTNNILKMTVNSISLPISLIFNICISKGEFPNSFKESIVIPIFKNGDKNKCSNYRPISLTLTISKLFEKCLKLRILQFLEKHNFFHKHQFGFRNNMSTYNALYETTKFIYDNIDNKQNVLGIFLDIKKAFDSVDHDILLNKLYLCGIRGIAHNLISSYLKGRVQRVKIDNELSDLTNINYSIPQGTVLGPLLFIIYINGLLNICTQSKLICFADDTVILVKNNNINDLYKIAENSFATVKNWMDNNSLSINMEKTKFIHFRIKNTFLTEDLKITVHSSNCLVNNNPTNICNCVSLDRVSSIKYLGVYIDENLKWNIHIKYINNTIKIFFYIFKSLKHILNYKLKKLTYIALVQSIISYGIPFWGGTYATHLYNLEVTLNSLVKFIFNMPHLFQTSRLYKELNILCLKSLYLKNNCLLMYNFKDDIAVPIHNYSTRLKSKSNVIIPNIRTVFGQQCPKYKFIQFCYDHDVNVHNFKNYSMYKNYINTLF